jgi:5-hydroxyisourate hydrolase
MGSLTTHVLDTVRGCPAAGMRVDFLVLEGNAPTLVCTVRTDAQGRTEAPLLADQAMRAAEYELLFHVGEYFRARGDALATPAFLERVPVRFGIADTAAHYHVPLLCSPWSYTTYRGS